MSTEIRVALLYQEAEAAQSLRSALSQAGVSILVDMRADALDAAKILASDVHAIVVNLDPELEDHFDAITDALEGATQPVMYNDPAASSDLGGWDRARWLRHLSAKLKGSRDTTPPPPPGAVAVPSVRKAVPVAAAPGADAASAVAAPAVTELAPTVEIPIVKPEPVNEAAHDDALDDLENLLSDFQPDFAQPAASAAAPVAAPTGDFGSDLGSELDALFAEQPKADDSLGLDLLFDEGSQTAPAIAGDGQDFAELDSLIVDLDAGPEARSSALAAGDELETLSLAELDVSLGTPAANTDVNELDSLFADLGSLEAPSAAATAQVDVPSFEDWALEPLEDAEAPAAAAAKPAPAKPSGPRIPEKLEQSLAKADLKLLDDTPEAAEGGEIEVEIGLLDDFNVDDLATPLATAAKPAATNIEDDVLNLSDLDFDLGSNAPAPEAELSLADLDHLFVGEDDGAPAAAAAPVAALADLSRVIVLGGSIGGPEAMKAFLAKLPAGTPAAFIVAQHMGTEFLAMMAAQLDAASPLAVRFPKSGERLRHGEVVVAPSGERLLIDAQGHLRFEPQGGQSPYSPSIDQITIDMTDRFGSRASLILFSGMGTDAIEGARYLRTRGGEVWAQSPSSCVIASMIEAAKAQGLVSFEGKPQELAEHLNASLG